MFQLAKAGEAIHTFFQRTGCFCQSKTNGGAIGPRERFRSMGVEGDGRTLGSNPDLRLYRDTRGDAEPIGPDLGELGRAVSTDLGAPVTPQGLEERMTDEAVSSCRPCSARA